MKIRLAEPARLNLKETREVLSLFRKNSKGQQLVRAVIKGPTRSLSLKTRLKTDSLGPNINYVNKCLTPAGLQIVRETRTFNYLRELQSDDVFVMFKVGGLR